MIFDKIDNWKLYFRHPLFVEIFEKLNDFNLATTNGVYRENKDYYFKVMDYDTKLDANIIESHKKEVDIQISLQGTERIKLYSLADVEISKPYSEEIDCQFYNKLNTPCAELVLKPEHMAIFFPQDIHQPQVVSYKEVENIKKIVIKVNEELFA